MKRTTYHTTEIIENEFNVYGENGEFYWLVYGERCTIDVEPLKQETVVKGMGPYTYISK